MANILSRIWGAITSCVRRELDQEIERVIEHHEEHHAVAHSNGYIAPASSPMIVINNWRERPLIAKRNGVSDLTKIEGYEEFRRGLRL